MMSERRRCPRCGHCRYIVRRDVCGTCADEIDEGRHRFDDDDLIRNMSALLSRTANELKGEPGPTRMHDWSDLPEVAHQKVVALDECLRKMAHL